MRHDPFSDLNKMLVETLTAGRERLRETVDRLKTLRCLSPRDGWYRLREEKKNQVPEE